MRAAFVLLSALAFGQSDALVRKSQEAKQLMAEGRFADAIPAYEELTHALPTNTGLRLNLALAYHMSGQHADAVPQ
ncbi:MAG TPA: tetratricopeptide repeat protein, partial [Bryobacteraceae bacterium]|nr:tetratricopeptide repeat protein [Bryobacteraceae bacterium]